MGIKGGTIILMIIAEELTKIEIEEAIGRDIGMIEKEGDHVRGIEIERNPGHLIYS